MELIKSVARRSKVSDVVYILLNIVLAGAVCGLTIIFSPPYIAYVLVLLSKWRVLAVRPRFWLANIQGNTIDILVGLSAVTLIWRAHGDIVVQILLGALYAAWLLVLKPRSKQRAVVIQAEVGQFLALTALFGVAYYLDSFFIVMACWVIGYIAAWHALQPYDEEHVTLLGMAWGFVVAEFGWVAYQWTSAYTLSSNLLAPQIALVVSLIGYVAMSSYDFQSKGSLTWKHIKAPVIFAIFAIIIMLFREFSGLGD